MHLFAISLCLGLSVSASSAVVVSKTGDCSQPVPTGEVVVTNNAGKWQVTFQPGAEATGTATYLVCGAPTDVIEYIRNPSGKSVSCSVSLVLAVEEITSSGQDSGLRVSSLRVVERLGPSQPTTAEMIVVDDLGTWLSTSGQLNAGVRSRGEIGTLFFPEATLRADVRAASGGIGSITCKSIEGTAQNPVDIAPSEALGNLVVGRTENGTLIGGDAKFVNIGDPSIAPVSRTMLLGNVTVANDFDGVIAAAEMTSTGVISIGRDLSGRVELERGFGGEVMSGASCRVALRVGRTFTTGSLLQLPVETGSFLPLTAMVAFNANRTATFDPQGQWNGGVAIGRDSNGDPLRFLAKDVTSQYTDDSVPLGYGSVGVPPFRI